MEFCNFVDYCQFMDLSFSGFPFTWCNKREGGDRVSERLDCFLANDAWLESLPQATVKHLSFYYSDHFPICLSLIGWNSNLAYGCKPFCFEAMWTRVLDCEDVIRRSLAFEKGNGVVSFVLSSISNCSHNLRKWNNDSFGNIQSQIHEKQAQLRDMYDLSISSPAIATELIKLLKEEIHELREREEILWKHHSKIQWLSDGDQNSKYFHSKASQR